jgi:hypothetical protein
VPAPAQMLGDLIMGLEVHESPMQHRAAAGEQTARLRVSGKGLGLGVYGLGSGVEDLGNQKLWLRSGMPNEKCQTRARSPGEGCACVTARERAQDL